MIIINNKMKNAGNEGNTKQLERCCHKGFTDWLHLYAKPFASAKAPSQNYRDSSHLRECNLHKGGQGAVHSLKSPYKVHCSHLQICESRGSSKTLPVIAFELYC